MKKYLTSGFTMIELLVVIAIIGVLAAAVLSAINPVEQINKGRDTRSRSDSAELVNAVERYYAVQEEFPWNTTSDTWVPGADLLGEPDAEFTVAAGGTEEDWAWMDILQSTDEVKENFVGRVAEESENLFLVKEEDSGTTYMCFEPTSTQFQQEGVTRCLADAPGLPTDYIDTICAESPVLDDDFIEFICIP